MYLLGAVVVPDNSPISDPPLAWTLKSVPSEQVLSLQ